MLIELRMESATKVGATALPVPVKLFQVNQVSGLTAFRLDVKPKPFSINWIYFHCEPEK